MKVNGNWNVLVNISQNIVCLFFSVCFAVHEDILKNVDNQTKVNGNQSALFTDI